MVSHPPSAVAARAADLGPGAPAAAAPPTGAGGIATIALRYLASSPVRLRGAVTARAYEFSAERPVQPVAAPDAVALLASRMFRRA